MPTYMSFVKWIDQGINARAWEHRSHGALRLPVRHVHQPPVAVAEGDGQLVPGDPPSLLRPHHVAGVVSADGVVLGAELVARPHVSARSPSTSAEWLAKKCWVASKPVMVWRTVSTQRSAGPRNTCFTPMLVKSPSISPSANTVLSRAQSRRSMDAA